MMRNRLRVAGLTLPAALAMSLVVPLAAQGAAAPVAAAPVAPAAVPDASTNRTFAAGSYIIDLGASTAAPAALQPYGLLYDLIVNQQIPVSWIIADGKAGGSAGITAATAATDFSATVQIDRAGAAVAKSYRSGAFVIPAELVDASVTALVDSAAFSATVVDRATTSFTAPEYSSLTSWPRIALDTGKGVQAVPYFTNAGIPNEARAYRFKTAAQVTACDDIYVLPDPDRRPSATLYGNLLAFNDQGGAIWAGCGSPSALEGLTVGTTRLAFLSTTGLLGDKEHRDPTPPLSYAATLNGRPAGSDPVMQFLGLLDASTRNGHEQVYLPAKSGGWRPTTQIVAWDPDHVDVPTRSPGQAAVLAYGRGFGDPTNGLVAYEAGHNLNAGTPGDAAAQRAFFNFILLASIDRSPLARLDPVPASMTAGQTYAIAATLSGGSAAYGYEWTSSCGGTFSTPTGSAPASGARVTTDFTAPSALTSATGCTLRIVVSDACDRVAFAAGATTVVPTADLQITKTVDKALVDAGSNVVYTLTVKNNGPAAADDVLVEDTLPVGATYVASTVTPPGGTFTQTGNELTWGLGPVAAAATTTISVTAAIGPGAKGQLLVNSATVESSTPDPSTANNASSASSLVADPKLTLLKSADQTTYESVGDSIAYSFAVTNTGNVALGDVRVTDPHPGLPAPTCTPAAGSSLAAGGSMTCTATYVVTQADLDRGTITDSATASGQPPSGSRVSATSALTVTSTARPGIAIVKSANPTSFTTVGQTITYGFAVTNTGKLSLSAVSVTDPLTGLSPISCPTTTLAPSESMSCTATYGVTQTDLGNRRIDNTATATAQPANGAPVSATASTTVTGSNAPNILVTKSASVPSYDALDQPITYSFKVTNTGNVTLRAIAVSDPLPGLSAISCPNLTAAGLAPSASTTCTATYAVRQADLDSGEIVNTVTASGQSPSGATVADTDTLTLLAVRTPSLSLAKSALPASYDTLGETITYGFAVTNTGNVTLTDVAVADPLPGLGAVSCPSTTLAPGSSTTCTATYQTVQADLDRGTITNTASASGQPPVGGRVSATSSVTINGSAAVAIDVVKSASPSAYGTAGQTIAYRFDVTNTGKRTLTAVRVEDSVLGVSTVVCPSTTLAPGATTACTAGYTVTQADLDRGSIVNVATASGAPPSGARVSATSTATITATTVTGIEIVKSSNVSLFSTVGQRIGYTFVVSNSGNLTMSAVRVDDPLIAAPGPVCPRTTLAPGESIACGATYAVTQADLDRGSVVNAATASGQPVRGPRVSSSSSVTVPSAQSAEVTLSKVLSGNADGDGDGKVSLGDVLTYTLTATNGGNVTLTGVVVDDVLTSATKGCASMAPKATCVLVTAYTVTQADVDAAEILNKGKVSATTPANVTITDEDNLGVALDVAPSVDLAKELTSNADGDGSNSVTVGDVLTFTLTATNDGDVTHAKVVVADVLTGASRTCTGVAPGATCVLTTTYAVTQADVDRGSLVNAATASGEPELFPAETDQASVTVPISRSPAVSLLKSLAANADGDASGTVSFGDFLTYSLVATNTGNVTLTNVVVSDPLTLSSKSCGSLAPKAACTMTTSYTVKQADVDAGTVSNLGSVTGTPPVGGDVTATSRATVAVPKTPGLSMVTTMTANADNDSSGTVSPGDVLTFVLAARNAGNATLGNVVVTDRLTGSSKTCPSLTPGAICSLTVTYTVKQSDVDAGTISDLGSARGNPPSGAALTASDPETVIIAHTPSITLSKLMTSNADGDATGTVTLGDVLTYTLTATNSGNVTLKAVSVTDPLTRDSTTCTVVLPKATCVLTTSYVVVQADVDKAVILNLGTAVGTPPAGPVVKDTDPEDIPVAQASGLALTMALSTQTDVDGSGTTSAGDIMSYVLGARNNGTIVLTDVNVSDSLTGYSTMCAELKPGDSCTILVLHTVTQLEVDRGAATTKGLARGNPPVGVPLVDDETLEVSIPRRGAVSLVASLQTASDPDASGTVSVGDLLTYAFEASNAGNVTLTNVTITDPLTGSTKTCSSLAIGARCSLIASHTVTAGDEFSHGVFTKATVVASSLAGVDLQAEDTELVLVEGRVAVLPPSDVVPTLLPELPATGSNVARVSWIAGSVVIAGGLLLVMACRPRPRRRRAR